MNPVIRIHEERGRNWHPPQKWTPPPPIKIYLRHGNLGAQSAASPFESANLITANNIARTHF